MKLTELKVLNDEELEVIDRSSRELLSEVGIRIKSREVLSFLEERGIAVDHDRQRATFDGEQVQRAVDLAPREIRVFDRDRSNSLILGEGKPPRFASGHNAVYTQDGSSRSRSPATKEDVFRFAKLANYLEEIDVVSPEAMPQDVPPRSSLLHGVDAVLNGTTKPILFSPESEREVASILDMVKVVSGGDRVGEKPIGICQFSPSSPLFWNEWTVKGFMRVTREGFPCTILPGPLAGATSPYSLAANLIQKNCEVLSGVVIAQLVNPGAPVLCYNGGGQFDMSSLTALLGTPEVTLILIAGSQLARYYGLPTHACIPTSDSHALDEQLAIENAMQVFAGTLSGSDLMVNAGMYATGETAALEQLVLDNELFKIARRLARGIRVDREHLCLEAFRRAGETGNFLEDPSTLRFLRSGEWSTSQLLTRDKYENWRAKGARTMGEKAAELAGSLLEREDVSLEEGKRREIAAIIRAFELAEN